MVVAFPFERNRRYPFSALRDFENKIREKRIANAVFSNELRAPSKSAPDWMRLRLKELLPLKIYGEHIGVSEHDTFLLMPEGNAVDVLLSHNGKDQKLQLTLAAPIWGETEKNSGAQYHKAMLALNESEFADWLASLSNRKWDCRG